MLYQQLYSSCTCAGVFLTIIIIVVVVIIIIIIIIIIVAVYMVRKDANDGNDDS